MNTGTGRRITAQLDSLRVLVFDVEGSLCIITRDSRDLVLFSVVDIGLDSRFGLIFAYVLVNFALVIVTLRSCICIFRLITC
jgi:hypothetical protein